MKTLNKLTKISYKYIPKSTNRYRDTIAGIFYAHTHKDHFQMFFSENGAPYHVGFVAQSQTIYNNLNVGYKIYHVDGNQGDTSYVSKLIIHTLNK